MTTKEKAYWARINELTERKTLVEVQTSKTRNGSKGIKFARLPSCMACEKISSKMYLFTYDEKATAKPYRHIAQKPRSADKTFALYRLDDNTFVAIDITDDESRAYYKKVFNSRNQIHGVPTGFVSKQGCVHINKLDFFLLSGYTQEEYDSQKNKKGAFILEYDTSENNCSMTLYFKKGRAAKKVPVVPRGGVMADTGIRKIKNPSLNFHIPKAIWNKGKIASGQYLIDHMETNPDGSMKLVIEAQPRICECCGKKIPWGIESHTAGIMCKPCVETLEEARKLIGHSVSDEVVSHRALTTYESVSYLLSVAKGILSK